MKGSPLHSQLPDRGRIPHYAIDSRLPSQNQKQALAGSYGTPGHANQYLTEDDAPATPEAGRITRLDSAGTLALPALPTLDALPLGPAPSSLIHQLTGITMFQFTPDAVDYIFDTAIFTLRWANTGIVSALNVNQAATLLGPYVFFNGIDEAIYCTDLTTNHYHMHATHNNVVVVIGRLDPGPAGTDVLISKWNAVSGDKEFRLAYDAATAKMQWVQNATSSYSANYLAEASYTAGNWFCAICSCCTGRKNKLALWQEGSALDDLAFNLATDTLPSLHNATAARTVIAAQDAGTGFTNWYQGDIALVFYKRLANSSTAWWDSITSLKQFVRLIMPYYCTVS